METTTKQSKFIIMIVINKLKKLKKKIQKYLKQLI